MQLEGIHHITAITGDARRNLDFYTRVLGLRLVKKTVNQDDPRSTTSSTRTRREAPAPISTFFEYPGRPTGSSRGRDGAPDPLARRFRGGARFLERPPGRRGPVVTGPTGGSASPTPRAWLTSSPWSSRLTSRSSRTPRDSGGARPAGLRRGSRVRDRPRAEQSAPRGGARLPATRDGLGGAGRSPRLRLCLDEPPTERGLPGGGTVHHVAFVDMEDHHAWQELVARAAAPDADYRPLLVPLDLLPRAERRPVRDRDARPGLHDGRVARASGRDALLPPAFEHLRDRIERVLTPLPDFRAWRPETT